MSKLIQWRNPVGQTVSVTITGDFSPREVNSDDVASRAEEITSEIKPLFQKSDLNILQLECAVTRRNTPIYKSGPNIRSHEGCLNFPKALGVDTVLLANNHTGDYGPDGLRDTLANCRASGFRTAGAGENAAEAAAPLFLTCHGLRIALLNQAEHEFGFAGEETPGCAGLDPVGLAGQITSLKKKVDSVWVALHGGHEHYPFPSPRLHRLCRFLADCGADLVFNCHTHCPCGYEIYHNVPIVYSPGNFYFPSTSTSFPCWYLGYLPRFCCDRQGAFALEITPYYNRKEKITLLNGEEEECFFQLLGKLNLPIQESGKLERLFEAWSAVHGADGYLTALFDLKQPESWENSRKDPKWLEVRDILCCEAHQELLRQAMILMEQGRIEKAKCLYPEITALQRPSWIPFLQNA